MVYATNKQKKDKEKAFCHLVMCTFPLSLYFYIFFICFIYIFLLLWLTCYVFLMCVEKKILVKVLKYPHLSNLSSQSCHYKGEQKRHRHCKLGANNYTSFKTCLLLTFYYFICVIKQHSSYCY